MPANTRKRPQTPANARKRPQSDSLLNCDMIEAEIAHLLAISTGTASRAAIWVPRVAHQPGLTTIRADD